MITQISGGVCAVGGVKAYGIKPGKMGLAIILGEGTAAGVFTRNKIIAAPAMLTRSHLEKNGGRLCGIIANSGNANAFTGEQGMADARAMAALLAEKLGVDPELIGVASTGVIGRKLDVDWIAAHTNEVFEKVTDSEEGNLGAMKAIMTTDTKQKECAVEVTVPEGKFRIGGICKGAGMIEPNMGTMLSFVYTDAGISSAAIRQSLVSAADKSFNMVVVDGDTSTNDMCLLTATGKSGIDVESSPALKAAFTEGLETVMKDARQKDRRRRRRRKQAHSGHRHRRRNAQRRRPCCKIDHQIAALQIRRLRKRPQLGTRRRSRRLFRRRIRPDEDLPRLLRRHTVRSPREKRRDHRQIIRQQPRSPQKDHVRRHRLRRNGPRRRHGIRRCLGLRPDIRLRPDQCRLHDMIFRTDTTRSFR